MARTSNRLRQHGINVIALDLTAIGQNLTPEQWYDGLSMRMGRQLRLEDEIEEFWRTNERLSPVQRFMTGLRDIIMARRPGPMVICVDEIDTVRSLPFSTDEFFAAIRECYNRRTEDPEFNRLTFCLLGVATPSDLIRDTRITPFNIGRRIELNDFTPGEAAPLANGLGRESKIATRLLEQILHWTNGHPFLTQRLCQAVAENPSVNTPGDVDRLCEELFLSNRAKERDDNLLFVRERLLRSEVKIADLLSLYDTVRRGNACAMMKRTRSSVCCASPEWCASWAVVCTYETAFTTVFLMARGCWQTCRTRKCTAPPETSVPPWPAARECRCRYRRGHRRWRRLADHQADPALAHRFDAPEFRRALRTIAFLRRHVRDQTGYRDRRGVRVVTSTICEVRIQKPDKARLELKVHNGLMDYEGLASSDGERLTTVLPSIRQFTSDVAQPSLAGVFALLPSRLGFDLPFGVYHLLAAENPALAFAKRARNLRFVRYGEEFEGQGTYVFAWEELASNLGPEAEGKPVPVTAWVDPDEGRIVQLVKNYTGIITQSTMPNFGGGSHSVEIQGFVLTVKHSKVKLNPSFTPQEFEFALPANAQEVKRFDFAAVAASAGQSSETTPQFSASRLAELIPKRDPNAPPELIDLSFITTRH